MKTQNQYLLNKIPQQAHDVAAVLRANNFGAYIVGGWVRDVLVGREAHDCDLATNATPEQVAAAFADHPQFFTVPTGAKYGTISVFTHTDPLPVEVTTYRKDGNYTDGRRPDAVLFGEHLADDLARRDFTMNAMALDVCSGRIIDPYDGRDDIRRGIIRCVGDARERFREDALRMLRAIRFVGQLGGVLHPMTLEAIQAQASMITRVSRERIHDELYKLFAVQHGAIPVALALLHQSGLMAHTVPDLCPMVGFDQRTPWHAYDLFTHTVLVVQYTPNDPVLRMAALLHDIGKLTCQTFSENGQAHYYGHADISAERANEICLGLKLSNDDRYRIVRAVRNHMTKLTAEMTDRTLRRLLATHGIDDMRDMLAIQRADDIAAGIRNVVDVDKEIAHMRQRIDEIAATAPTQPRQLAVNGHDVMYALDCPPGRLVGQALAFLQEAVLDDPLCNTREQLMALLRTPAIVERFARGARVDTPV
jgi:tRNA nucleotidyltransferase (CCA-adding enzyme)